MRASQVFIQPVLPVLCLLLSLLRWKALLHMCSNHMQNLGNDQLITCKLPHAGC